jgi:hypothetical protein
MKKTVKFYSEQESEQVKEFAMTGLPVKGLIEDFCRISDRSFHSVACRIYEIRNRLNIPRNIKTGKTIKDVKISKTELTPAKDQSKVNIGIGEFNIPIKSWGITQHKDGFYFNVKF